MTNKIFPTIAFCALSVIAGRLPAETLLPLDTEDAAPIEHGTVEAYFGAAYASEQRFPYFTPKDSVRSHDLYGLPQFGFRFGAGDWVEIQASMEFVMIDEELANGDENSEYGAGDAQLYTKARILDEDGGWPAFSMRFGTKLPNSSVDDRLGTDETDFEIETLFSRGFGPVTGHLNVGILILGNPGPTVEGSTAFDSDGQDDLVTWGVAGVTEPVADLGGWQLRLLGEVAGMSASRFDNDRSNVRLAIQAESGAWMGYFGANAGIDDGSEDFGVRGGLLYRFRPGQWFAD